MKRREFLKMVGVAAVAPFIPSWAVMPEPDPLQTVTHSWWKGDGSVIITPWNVNPGDRWGVGNLELADALQEIINKKVQDNMDGWESNFNHALESLFL